MRKTRREGGKRSLYEGMEHIGHISGAVARGILEDLLKGGEQFVGSPVLPALTLDRRCCAAPPAQELTQTGQGRLTVSPAEGRLHLPPRLPRRGHDGREALMR